MRQTCRWPRTTRTQKSKQCCKEPVGLYGSPSSRGAVLQKAPGGQDVKRYMPFLVASKSSSVSSYAQCSRLCLTTGDTVASFQCLFWLMTFLMRMRRHLQRTVSVATQHAASRADSDVGKRLSWVKLWAVSMNEHRLLTRLLRSTIVQARRRTCTCKIGQPVA